MDWEKKYNEALERARAGMPFDKVFPELYESEDERIRKEIIECIETLIKAPGANPRLCDWLAYLEKQKEPSELEQLKKLREMTHEIRKAYERGIKVGRDEVKSAEWSEEERRLLHNAENAVYQVASAGIGGYTKKDYEEISSFFRTLRPQPKNELSEEDEERLYSIIESYKDLLKDYKACHDVDYIPYNSNTVIRNVVDDVNFLKSLRPQPHWKPSEEQLDALLASYKEDEGVYDYYALESLYNELSKL